MRRYTIFHLPTLSFYSKDLYREVARLWSGTGLAWLFLLEALCWLMIAIRIHLAIGQAVDNFNAHIVSQVPKISIVQGVVSTEVPQPYFIRDPGSQKPICLIDTREPAEAVPGESQIPMVIKRNDLVLNSQGRTNTYSLRQVPALIVDKEMLTQIFLLFKKLFAWFFYPVAVIVAFSFRASQIQAYALIGMGIASANGQTLSYSALRRLSAVAVTPVILVETLFDICCINVPPLLLWPAAFLTTTLLLIYGIQAATAEPA